VERTLAWLGRNRRLPKDYEFLPETEEAHIYVGMIRLMLHRLARQGNETFQTPSYLDFIHLEISAMKVMLIAMGAFLHVPFGERHSKNLALAIALIHWHSM
jgi:hypothetical protein